MEVVLLRSKQPFWLEELELLDLEEIALSSRLLLLIFSLPSLPHLAIFISHKQELEIIFI